MIQLAQMLKRSHWTFSVVSGTDVGLCWSEIASLKINGAPLAVLFQNNGMKHCLSFSEKRSLDKRHTKYLRETYLSHVISLSLYLSPSPSLSLSLFLSLSLSPSRYIFVYYFQLFIIFIILVYFLLCSSKTEEVI